MHASVKISVRISENSCSSVNTKTNKQTAYTSGLKNRSHTVSDIVSYIAHIKTISESHRAVESFFS